MSELVFFQTIVIICGTTGVVASLRVLTRYLELRRERPDPGALDGVHARLARIEQIAEVTAVEVERLSEINRYMARLLAERGDVQLPAARPERVITPH